MMQEVRFGGKLIQFTIQFADRKSMGINVHPDGSVKVIAPNGTSEPVIINKVKGKAGWILKQQAHFISYLPLTPPRKYLNGETHLYLGRQYRLKKQIGDAEAVKLYRGYLEVYSNTDTPESITAILTNWYKSRAEEIFRGLFNEAIYKYPMFQDKNATLVIKPLLTKWGSCAPSGKVILNVDLIKAPRACIEYVIIHELCHLIYPNHSKKFFALLTEFIPDWEKWKGRLEQGMV